MLSRSRAGLSLLALTATLVLAPNSPAAGTPAVEASSAAALLPNAAAGRQGARTLTLVTGDRFAVGADGQSVARLRSPGREGMHYLTRRHGGRLEVVPADALPLLAEGRLDPRLFDVTALLRSGYDDRRGSLPLIVEYADGDRGERTLRERVAAAPGAKVVKDLAAVDGLALEQGRERAADLWTSLTSPATTGSAAGGVRALRDGIAKVWLDGRRELQLDESVALVGAPKAWAAGFTGAGVPVGVIDSGVDATHPDLAGRVAEARDFTGAGLADTSGHGTHVAATIASAGGTFRGVAPGATIFSGKVCPNRSCPESAMIEAMRWMAADLRLKVVNISIGGRDEPGDDPLEAAVDTLSREFGTLFVISAGNGGANEPVSSPASAEHALAVAATTKADTVAEFSSGGPRADAGVLKPEISAPGSDIVAAEAGTGGHVTMSGTSMAAPHVTGAAAILAQRRPEWSAAQLKAALIGSAAALRTEVSAYEQGAGRLDVARAVGQNMTTTPATVQVDDLSPAGAVTTRTVKYRNTGGSAAKLRLALTARDPLGRAAPTGLFRLSKRSVTVAAGGEASVDVVVDARKATRPGAFGGVLTATGADTSVRTPIGLDRQPTVRLSLSHVDRNGGTSPRSRVVVAGLDNRVVHHVTEQPGGRAELRLPAGRYLVSSTVMTPTATDRTVTMLTDPELDLTADTTLVMDARHGKPVEVTTDRPGAVQASGFLNLTVAAGAGELLTFGIGGPFDRVFSARLGGGSDKHVRTLISAGFTDPGDDGSGTNSPWTLTATRAEPGVPDGYRAAVPVAGSAVVRQDLASGVDGSTADLFHIPHWPGHGPDEFAFGAEHALPGVRTDHFVSASGVTWETQLWHNARGMSDFPPGAATYSHSWNARPEAYGEGQEYTRTWNRAVFGPAFHAGEPGAAPLLRDGDRISGTPNLYSDDQGRYGSAIVDSTSVRLERNGEPLTSQNYLALDAAVPPQPATYRLQVDTVRRAAVGLATRNTVAWTFGSASTGSAEPLPLSVLRFRPEIDNRNTVIGAGTYTIAYDVQAQPGSAAPPVTGVTVELSHDGGATWLTPEVTQAGVVRAARPGGSGTVSIRSTAVDAAGGKVEQTILHAFRY